jgi:hypothetical protein
VLNGSFLCRCHEKCQQAVSVFSHHAVSGSVQRQLFGGLEVQSTTSRLTRGLESSSGKHFLLNLFPAYTTLAPAVASWVSRTTLKHETCDNHFMLFTRFLIVGAFTTALSLLRRIDTCNALFDDRNVGSLPVLKSLLFLFLPLAGPCCKDVSALPE